MRLQPQLPTRRERFVPRLPSPEDGKSLPGGGAASPAKAGFEFCNPREGPVELLCAAEGAVGVRRATTPLPHGEGEGRLHSYATAGTVALRPSAG